MPDFIGSIVDYDPWKAEKGLSGKKLQEHIQRVADDFRICCAWYAIKKKGGQLDKSFEVIERLTLAIVKYLGEKGRKFHPSKMEKISRELFRKVFKKLGSPSEILAEDESGDFRELAPVNPSGVELGDEVHLDEVLSYFKSFKLKQPYLYIVGGLATRKKTKGDIDILIKDAPTEEQKLPLEFRILRMLPEKYWTRVSFLYDVEHHGPFTNNVPLGDLMVEVYPKLEVHQMKEPPSPFDYFNGTKHPGLRKQLPGTDLAEVNFHVITFLGTACEMLYPRPDCDCPQCEEASKRIDYHKNNSSILLEWEGHKLMIDAGTTFKGKINDIGPDWLLITHAHPDHIEGLIEPVDCPVYLSQDSLDYVKNYPTKNPHIIKDGKEFELEGAKILPFKVSHSLKVETLGFRISLQGATFVYLPDVLSIPDKDKILEGLNLYIGDGSSLKREIVRRKDDKAFGHASMERQIKWCEEAGVKQIYFTHIGHVKLSHKALEDELQKLSPKAYVATDQCILTWNHNPAISPSAFPRDPFLFWFSEKKRVPNWMKQGTESKNSDSVKPFRLFFMLKPMHGRVKEEVYSTETVLRTMNQYWEDWKEVGVFVDRKFDGVHCQVHKPGEKAVIYSEDGMDYSRTAPTLVKEFASKKGDWIVCCEIEMWKDGKHQNRAITAGCLNAKEAQEDEKYLRANLFDKVLHNGEDIHKLPYSDRLKHLEQMQETEHVKIAERKLCKTEKEVKEAIEYFSKQEGSEGAMIKLANHIYELDGQTRKVIKFKNEVSLDAQVIQVNRVKDAPKTFYYHCAIKDEKGNLVYVGKTFNTNIKAKVGDIIKVIFVDLNKYVDPDTGRVWFNWWAPRVSMLREDKKEPDTTTTAERINKMTSARTIEMKYPKRLRDIIATEDGIFSFEELPDLPGIYLVEPHARWIAEGYKTAIVKARHYTKYSNQDLYLISDSICYGIIQILDPEPIDLEEFEKRRDLHRVSDEERERWWPDYDKLWFHCVKLVEIWDEPKEIILPLGIQTFLKEVKFK